MLKPKWTREHISTPLEAKVPKAPGENRPSGTYSTGGVNIDLDASSDAHLGFRLSRAIDRITAEFTPELLSHLSPDETQGKSALDRIEFTSLEAIRVWERGWMALLGTIRQRRAAQTIKEEK